MIRHGKLRRLHPEVLHFFDTNFPVRPISELPPLVNVPVDCRWISETVRQEAIENLGEAAQQELDSHYQVLDFRSLYEKDHGVCPVFYWFVLSMYNRATVGSASFFEDWFQSRLIKKTVTQYDREIYEKLRRQMGGSAIAKKNGPGYTPDRLKKMSARLHKKARRSLWDRHPAYIRDIKSLSLALYTSLWSRRNGVYHTADGDAGILLFKWLNSTTMWLTMGNVVFSRMSDLDRQIVMSGGRIEIVLDYAEFFREKSRLFESMLSDRRRTDACRFTIAHWSPAERKLDEDIYLVFEDEIAGWLSNMHGPMSCGGTANAELGNWLGFRYWPPDEDHPGKLRIRVYRKSTVRREPMDINALEHDRRCRYRQDDMSGKIQDWSQFI